MPPPLSHTAAGTPAALQSSVANTPARTTSWDTDPRPQGDEASELANRSPEISLGSQDHTEPQIEGSPQKCFTSQTVTPETSQATQRTVPLMCF